MNIADSTIVDTAAPECWVCWKFKLGEDSTTTPVPIGQQKAAAILPEVHPVTGELDTTTVSTVCEVKVQ